MSEQSTNSNEETYQEFIPKGETSSNGKEDGRSKSQKFGDQLAEEYQNNLNEELDEVNKNFNDDDKAEYKNIDQLVSNFDSIIKQSNEHSNTIAEKIRIGDLGEESTNLLIETTTGLEKIHNDRSLAEKSISLIPIPMIRNKLNKALNVAEKEMKRNQTVRDYSKEHFDQLQHQKDSVNENRIAVDEMSQKLVQSNEILDEIRRDANSNLNYMEENDVHNKREEIKTKELILNVSQQIISQNDILEQARMFEGISSAINEKITATLPLLRTQMTDQVSVTASLKNLKNLKEDLDATKDMVLTMQKNSLKEMNNIMDDLNKHGMGETKKQTDLRKENDKQLDEIRKKRTEFANSYERNLHKQIVNVNQSIEKSNESLKETDDLNNFKINK